MPVLLWHHSEEETPWFSLKSYNHEPKTNKPGGKHCHSYTHERLKYIVNEAALDKESHSTCKFIVYLWFKEFQHIKVFEVFDNDSC